MTSQYALTKPMKHPPKKELPVEGPLKRTISYIFSLPLKIVFALRMV